MQTYEAALITGHVVQSPMPPSSPEEFADLLRRTAWPVLAETPLGEGVRATPEQRERFVREFRDEAGNRRGVDQPLLWCLLGPQPSVDVNRDLPLHERAWWALALRTPHHAIDTLGEGPMAPEMQRHGIEVWTECELATLHAAWSLADLHRDDALRSRTTKAALWLMRELQPDNATNRPWAAHVFLMLSKEAGDDAGLYARTLLHNAIVERGRPERLSACIMLHAAGALDTSTAEH